MYIFTEEDFIDFHLKCGVIDAHCDTVHYFSGAKGNYKFNEENTTAHLDLPRMEKGGIKLQFFALFVEPEYKPAGALKRTLQLLDIFYQTIGKNNKDNKLITIYSVRDLERVKKELKIGALLAVEGGEALEGELGNLRLLSHLGIRSMGLTWNQGNEIAAGIAEESKGRGLTAFGKEVVREMNALGMLIDLAHISKKSFFDVLSKTSAPVIVSHANAKKICHHPRNLSDEQLLALRNNGGVIGLTFCPAFVHHQDPSLEKLLDHFVHVASLIGVEHLGIGSDFDGFDGCLKGLKDVSCLSALTLGLFTRGFQEEEIRKILFQNFYGIIKRVIGKAR